MKVLLLRANPRKTGYTQRLTDLFVEGLRETGAQLKDCDLAGLSIRHCLGCYRCWLVTPGQCVLRDDMSALLEEFLAAELIVCATPLYFYSMSGRLKTFIERTFPLTKQGFVRSAQGRIRNSTRYPERWAGKKLVAIIAGALKDPAVYRPLRETFELIADALDLEFAGCLTRPESYLLDFPLSKPITLKKIEAAFRQAGREAGTRGRLSEETMANAALPLAVDGEHFRTYSNVYWARASELGEAALAPPEVRKRVAADVRILLREMVRSLDAKAAARLRAVLQFEFPDLGQVYRVCIRAGQCELAEGGAPEPDLRIRCPSEVWAAVFTRQMDVREALRSRQLALEGDKSLFARLDRLFPPPSA
jgi:putative NADPH-quinone reductase/putative sterol carrier protein